MHLSDRLLAALFLLALLSGRVSAEAKPLKVFVLAGQSNMEGHARVETFDFIGDDPATAPLLAVMRGADGRPTVCDHTWISYLTGSGGNDGEGVGRLTAGYGARSNPQEDGGKIGPEFTFGLTMDAALAEPVLIIKTAWGGKSLHTDFRPPSAGPYELNDFQKKLYYGPPGHGVPQDMEKWLAEKKRDTGHSYRLMVEHVRQVLADPRRVVPTYEPAQGHEIAGFVWLQGFNDMVDGHTYPDRGRPGRFDHYAEYLAHLIRDVRRDLGAPQMPFVIGVMGVGGLDAETDTQEFRRAMRAPAALPEFQGTVSAVETAPFWAEELAVIDRETGKQWPVQLRAAGMPFTAGNRADLLVDGDATFDSIFEGIAAAQHYVFVQFYIIRHDSLGQRLAAVLMERARAGVAVYVLYDDVGSGSMSEEFRERL